MSELMVLDMGELALPYDETLVAELTKDIAQGFGGKFKRAARLSMGNSGDWELIDSEGEVHDMGREVDLVIVDQRTYNSRIHYAKSYDEQKLSGEFEAPDCYSTDGQYPDTSVENPLCNSCKECPYNKTSKNWVDGNVMCSIYRRIVGVLVNEDGSFSDPFVLEIKYQSLSDDVVVNGRYGSYGWYMRSLTNQRHPRTGAPMPVPTQFIVTHCMPKPKMSTSTIKFGIAANNAGGYWTLTAEQRDEILRLKDSDEVKEMLEPFNAAFNNPSSAGRIEVKNVEAEEPKAEAKKTEATAKKAPPAKKEAPAKKPAPTKKVKMVVLGMDHPDVVHTTEYDYNELKEWAAEATPEEVKEFLADAFPQALEPVEVPDDEQVAEEPKAKPAPKRKASVKKEAKVENVVDTSGEVVSEAEATEAEELANGLDDFDD